MVMSSQRLATPLPVGTAIVPGTLRARLEEVRSRGERMNLKQAVGIVVPLCVEVADLHRAGHRLFVHPSSLVENEYGFFNVSVELAQKPPILPRDKACLAPEERSGQPGSARASVFAVGAILYELVTGSSLGPGMRRPSEVVSALPQNFEAVLAKALVADPAHRPDDLNALAQALHTFAPPGSLAPPPPADVSRLDHDSNFEVDLRMSMLPPEDLPEQYKARAMPQAAPVSKPTVSRPMDATTELASLKTRLESDPRPRYVVVKDGMDHGPFSAVELLQQIASHTFVETDVLRDSLSNDERTIKDWDEFAPFAEHARLHRDIKAEKAAIDRVVVAESRSTKGKTIFGLALLGAFLAAGAVWFLTKRGAKSDEVEMMDDTMSNIEVDGGLNATGKRAGGGGKRVVGRGPGGVPILSGGMSCEAAQNAYVEEMSVGGPRGQADITGGQYGSILNRGTYFGHCGVPDSTGLNICAAVQNGRAVGVTVVAKPRNRGIESCVAASVRGLSFPSHPKLDVTRTTF
jgi:eukaryotic-like serine/threonine-protein kinase